MKIKIENFKEQIKDNISNINYIEVVLKKILIMSWIWWFFPEILYLIAGIEERPNILEDPVLFIVTRAITLIVTATIIKKIIVPKIIEKRIIPKIIGSLKKSIQQHNNILNLVVSIIIAKFSSFNAISLFIAIYDTSVINFMSNNIGLS